MMHHDARHGATHWRPAETPRMWEPTIIQNEDEMIDLLLMHSASASMGAVMLFWVSLDIVVVGGVEWL